MNKRIAINVFIIFLFIVCISIDIYSVCAFGVQDLNGKNVKLNDVNNMGQKIIQIASTIGSIVSVIVIIVLGIKYMMGSVEEKAEYKKSLLPYIIGAAFVFAASNIANMVYVIAKEL